MEFNLGNRGNYDDSNLLNELTDKEWEDFTRSWVLQFEAESRLGSYDHPYPFSASFAKRFISFFTRRNDTVLDPFAGIGSALVASNELARNSIGIEINQHHANNAASRVRKISPQTKLSDTKIIKTRHLVLFDDSENIDVIWKKESLPKIDFIFTEPPQPWMRPQHQADLSSLQYDDYIKRLSNIFIRCRNILKPQKYLAIIVKNYTSKDGYMDLAHGIISALSPHFTFKGEIVLCEKKKLYPFGYKYDFIPNIHHKYCLIFRNQ